MINGERNYSYIINILLTSLGLYKTTLEIISLKSFLNRLSK